MNTFQLTIDLGNDAMQTGADVARLLTDLARKLKDAYDPFAKVDGGTLRDINGNTVAKWEVR
jgi:uncharacterized protein (DUF2342 family)